MYISSSEVSNGGALPKHEEETGACSFVVASSMFTASRVFSALLGAVRGFLLAKWLGPAAYGTWQFVNIFGHYGVYAGLGTRAGISREIPFLRGGGNFRRMSAVLGTAFAANLYGPLSYGLIVLGCSFFVLETVDAKALAMFSPVIVLTSLVGYGGTLAMAMGLYDVRTKLGLLEDLLTGFLTVGFVYIWGVYGAIAGFGLAALIAAIYAAWRLWQYLALGIDWRMFLNLVVIGLPIMGNGILLTTMGTADQILIAAMLGREMLGVYGLMRSGVVVLQAIPASLGQVLFVKFAELDGKNQSNEGITHLLDKTTLILSAVLAPILSSAAALLPLVIVLFLPEFTEGIQAGQVLIGALFFMGVSLPATNWCVSTLRNGPVLALRIAVVAAECGALYWVISVGGGLEAIASIVLAAFASFSVAIMIISNYLLGTTISGGFVRAIRSGLPFLAIAVVLLLQSGFSQTGSSFVETHLFISVGVNLVCGLLVSAAFVMWIDRRTHFLRVISRTFGAILRLPGRNLAKVSAGKLFRIKS